MGKRDDSEKVVPISNIDEEAPVEESPVTVKPGLAVDAKIQTIEDDENKLL